MTQLNWKTKSLLIEHSHITMVLNIKNTQQNCQIYIHRTCIERTLEDSKVATATPEF